MAKPQVLPEPEGSTADTTSLFERYLVFYRETVIRKASSLSEPALRASRLPSGWSPIELVRHLGYMERRWIVWGFLGEPVDEPWGDSAGDRWRVPDGVGLPETVAQLRDVGRRTADVLEHHALDEAAAVGGRFDADPPTLAWICFHVLQEYARHAGHLDVAVELAGGPLGE